MTANEFASLDLPVGADEMLYVESGLEWIRDRTALKVDIDSVESVKALPSSARLFLVKFCEICRRDPGVASEGVGPLSQSFTPDSVEKQTTALARQLLKPWLKADVRFIPCKRRWY